MKIFKAVSTSVLVTLGFVVASSFVLATGDVPVKNNVVNAGICNARRHQAINIVRFYSNQEQRILAIYGKRVSQLQTVSDSFAKSGKNTDKLQSDINTLKGKIDQLKSDIDLLSSKAKDFENLACDNQSWKQAINDIVAQQKKIHQDKVDIETYIRTVINPDIIALRKIVTPTPSVTPTPTPTP